MHFDGGNTSTKLKVIEVKLAASVCCHMSLVAFDHVGELIREGGKGSILEDLKLHRTKLSRLADHVISPAFKKELKEDINGSRYSLLCDETTGVSTQMTLSLCIIFFSPKTEKIETAFLGLYPVIEATREKLFRIIQEALVEVGLVLPQCVVFGSDGASNMVGEYNSVWSRVKNESLNCILFTCVRHSLALCVQKAFEKLPSSLGYLLNEVAAWFSKSSIRREDYKQLFESMKEMDENAEETEETTSCTESGRLPFMKASTTRCLVRGKLIHNMINNWNCLRAYFTAVEISAGQGSCCKARYIK